MYFWRWYLVETCGCLYDNKRVITSYKESSFSLAGVKLLLENLLNWWACMYMTYTRDNQLCLLLKKEPQ